MHSLTCTPLSSSYSSHHTTLKPNLNPLLGADATFRPCSLPLKRRTCFTTRAILSSTREDVLKHFSERRALKVSVTKVKIHLLLSLPFCRFVAFLHPGVVLFFSPCVWCLWAGLFDVR